jgi:sulfur carrier protein
MEVIVNGESRKLDDTSSLVDLLVDMNLAPDQTGVAVAVNAEVVARNVWSEVRLTDGDRVDIIHAVQGG